MKGFAAAPIVAAAALACALGALPARAELADGGDEAAADCRVSGMSLARAKDAAPSRFEILWNPVDEAQVVRADAALEVRLDGAGGVLRGERAYVLTGVELRARSGSARYPAEARFFHQNASGDQVVVDVYLTEGAANPAVETLRAAAAAQDGQVLSGLDLRELLPMTDARLRLADRTPAACAQHVLWTVLDAPAEASRDQLAALASAEQAEQSPGAAE